MSAWGGAQTASNTTGSGDSTAINGYDVVAFHTQRKALHGDAKISVGYGGAKWLFSSEENKALFESAPEKYLPAWGGQCAWAVSHGGLSRKLLSGDFEVIQGQLYLFSYGNNRKSGARDHFVYGRHPVNILVRDGNRHWPELKRKLEEGSMAQPDLGNYSKSPFEGSR